MPDNERKPPQSNKAEIPRIEWIAGTIGLLMLLAVIAFLLYEVATDEGRPPQMTIKIEEITPAGEQYLVQFSIQNSGDETAADVLIEGTLHEGETLIETSEATLTFVPAGSTRKGGLYFAENPADFALEIVAKGYEQP